MYSKTGFFAIFGVAVLFTGIDVLWIPRGSVAKSGDRLAENGDILKVPIRCDGINDDRATIQKALDSGPVVQLPAGRCLLSGSIRIPPGRKLIGLGRTGSADGGYAQFGTQLWGTSGGGDALLSTASGTANGGLSISHLTIATALTTNYDWVVRFTGMSNSIFDDVLVQNNSERAKGSVFFMNENPGQAIDPHFPPVWSNSIIHSVFGTRGGSPLFNQLTDSRFDDIYLSGGTGSVENGANNTMSTFMVDSAKDTGLRVEPRVNSSSLFVIVGGNFQNCAKICLSLIGKAVKPDSGNIVSGISFNNTTSETADVTISNLSGAILSNVIFSTASRVNIQFSGQNRRILLNGAILSGMLAGDSGRQSLSSSIVTSIH